MVDTAHRTLQDYSRIFRYAIATGKAGRDPAADLKGALAPVKSTSFASIKEPAAIGVLLRDIDACTGNRIVRAALQLAPYRTWCGWGTTKYLKRKDYFFPNPHSTPRGATPHRSPAGRTAARGGKAGGVGE